MQDYDIEKAFAVIEKELIASMIRNMKSHKAEEVMEGFQWEQWQVKQLESLEKYKKQNRKKFQKPFSDINGSIEGILSAARTEGGMSQEIAIMNAIKKGWKPPKALNNSVKTSAEFFKLNDRKLEALIKATTQDFTKAEHAMLRMADDQYRKIIFNAQVYANTGAGTYEKAVDMATKDFLTSGINCIEYANGARHTIKDYAAMAIQTAAKRAYLTGEGEKRQEWGISTVIMNKRGNPCPKCLPFVGKILIDDVWSGGKPSDGSYKLMSSAISSGLYHPRCKDSHTTYFPGISSPPDDKFSNQEISDIEQNTKEDVKQQNAQRQADRFGRLADYSLDPSNKRIYKTRAEEWEKKTKISNNKLRTDSEKYNLDNLSPRISNLDWADYIDIEMDNVIQLNDIHSDLNKHMITNKTEKSVLLSLSNHKPISVDIGDAVDEVVLSEKTIKALKQGEENDIIMSHVHPSKISFSRNDIDKLVVNKSVRALTVECPDGTKYILERGTYKSSKLLYWKYDSVFSKAEKAAQAKYPAFLNNDEKELEKIWDSYVDERNAIIADKLGMVYKKVVIK